MNEEARAVLIEELPWKMYRCMNSMCTRGRPPKGILNPFLLGIFKIAIGVIKCKRCGYINVFTGSDDEGIILSTTEYERYNVPSGKGGVRSYAISE